MRFKKKLYYIVNLLYLIILLFLTGISLNAQTIEWTKTFGSTGQDGGESMILTSDGAIVIGGFKSSTKLIQGHSAYEDRLIR